MKVKIQTMLGDIVVRLYDETRTLLLTKRRLWMTLESHVMCWRMERSRSIRRT